MAGKPEFSSTPSIIAILIGMVQPPAEPQGREFGAALQAFNTTGEVHLGPQLNLLLPAVQHELNVLGQPFTPDHDVL